jgi:predicted nucleic acid-binding protein
LIAYFDTSALLPLLVIEPATPAAREMWDGASRVVSVRLVYPESRAALAQAERARRLTMRQLRATVRLLDEQYYPQLDVVEVNGALARYAGELAESLRLRGYDAVHLAAALWLDEPDLVLVAGDSDLLTAASNAGLATAATV